MKTEIYKITDPEKQKKEIEEIAAFLKKGETAAIPTETVYGLAADAFNKAAIKKIFEAKGRPQDNPLIVHITEISELELLAEKVPEKALRLGEKFWPGPLTIILPKKKEVPDEVSAGLSTVAIRMPSHSVARAIIKAAGTPLAAPSANISGFPSPTTAESVIDDMNGRIAAIADGGDCGYGIESTVITLAEKTPVLLRPGAVTLEQLKEVLGEVRVDKAVLNPLEKGVKAASPGMKYKHYSPRAELKIVRGDKEEFISYAEKHKKDADFILCFEGEEGDMPLPAVSFGRENDSLSQAKRLFDALRELDRKGAERVFVRAPSEKGVGLGVCNRLYRAAAFRFLPEKGCILGLTGESGSGKSTVSEILSEKGFIILDADKIYKRLLKEDERLLKSLSESFGKDIIKNGDLDRRLLAERAFSSDKNRILLDSITHPAIVKEVKNQAEEYSGKGFSVIVDAPLLFLSGLDKICDITVKVTAPEKIRLERIMKRDNISEEQALLRFSAHKEENRLSEKADYILKNYPPYNIYEETEKLKGQVKNYE